MMMQPDGQLDQSLEKLLLLVRRGPPNVLQDFMRVVKLAVIKKFEPALIAGQVHRYLPNMG